MLAKAHTFTVHGPKAHHVLVEVDIRLGLPAFTIVGLPNVAVREARERIQTAIRNCGFEFPMRRITVNLAPGELPKAGAGLDLAIACAVLAASGQVEPAQLRDVALFGELALDGCVRSSHGTLAVAHATKKHGLRRLGVACTSALEADLIDDLDVAPLADLSSAVRVLRGGTADPPRRSRAVKSVSLGPLPDLEDVRGQPFAVRALLVAAAGGHSILLSGAPGTGKTMLASRLPSILPPLERPEAVEAMMVDLAAGAPVSGLHRRRPFRAPHHSITAAGMVGGAGISSVGEAVRAHRGVLFLDELPEFTRSALEALRQPIEDGQVTIARAGHRDVYPSRFMLVAAMNPCPCGYAYEPRRCECSASEVRRHARRISGPLLDRIDIRISLTRRPGGEPTGATGKSGDLNDGATVTISSAEARGRVQSARARQRSRFRSDRISVNAEMSPRLIRANMRLDEDGKGILTRARSCGLLSARGEDRVLRVARTLADLDGSDEVRTRDVSEAIALRRVPSGRDDRA